MPIIEIQDIHDPQVRMFTSMTEAQLRQEKEEGEGIFIAESSKVIHVALNAGYEPLALLCERKHIQGDAAGIIDRCRQRWDARHHDDPDGFPVYTGDRDTLTGITGYKLTRGVLCAMRRQPLPTVEDVVLRARRIVVIDGVVDTTNIGGIFRSAAALGIDAVLLTRNSCDPLNRRAIRVSMGNIFLIPWTWLNGSLETLHELGFKTVAMALTDKSIALDDPDLNKEPRLAIVMGTEGDGLPQEAIDACDYTVRIPMAYGVDSLNVNAAAAVAFWQLRIK